MGKIGVWAIPKEPGVKLATGSYVGTNNRGPSWPNTITFPFVPKFFILSGPGANDHNGGSAILVYGDTSVTFEYGHCTVIWSGKTVKWYFSDDMVDNNGSYQANAKATYKWIAVG